MRDLPLVNPDGCTLTPSGMAAQRARLHALRPSVLGLERGPRTLSVRFASGHDAAALAAVAETERECCAFLAVDHDGGAGVLHLAVGEQDGTEVLDLFEAALTGSQEVKP